MKEILTNAFFTILLCLGAFLFVLVVVLVFGMRYIMIGLVIAIAFICNIFLPNKSRININFK